MTNKEKREWLQHLELECWEELKLTLTAHDLRNRLISIEIIHEMLSDYGPDEDEDEEDNGND